MFSPMFRIRRSTSNGFLRSSACPNQYTRGRSAEEVRAVGAEVAVEPKGFPGEAVGIGIEIGQAETVPGTVHPPCSTEINRNLVQLRATGL